MSYKENKKCKQTLESAQYGLEIIFNAEDMRAEIAACVLCGCLY